MGVSQLQFLHFCRVKANTVWQISSHNILHQSSIICFIVCQSQSVIMSSSKPKINIEKALRELNLQMSHRYECGEHPLTEISSNIPSNDISRKDSRDITNAAHRSKKMSNKENQLQICPIKVKQEPAEEQQGKSCTYVAISKALQHKTQLIGQQKHEIQVLRQCVQDVKYSKQARNNEEIKVKSEQLAALKLKEKEYLQGLSEIMGLKENLEDIRRKYNQTAAEKNALQQQRNSLIMQRNSLLGERGVLTSRCNSLYVECEELTIAITHLKQEKEENQAAIRALEDQVISLKEQLRDKANIQERAMLLERKVNECLCKLSESQQQYNTYQIKYYRLQQECDTLREEGEQRLASALRQCRTEREDHEQEVFKIILSLRNVEQRTILQEKTIIELQQQRKRMQNSTELARLSQCLRQAQQVNELLQQEGRKWESYTKELTKQYQQDKDYLNNQRNTFQSEVVALKEEIVLIKSKLEASISQRDTLEQKNLEISNEREHIIQHYSTLMSQRQEQNRSIMLAHASDQLSMNQAKLEQKRKQQEDILYKIQQLEMKLTQENHHLAERNTYLQDLNTSLNEQLTNTITETNTIKQQKRNIIEELRVIRQREQSEVRFYQEKYEQQLLQYNHLSQYSHSVQLEHAALFKTNTSNVIELSNFKAEIALLHADLSKLIATSSRDSQIASLCQQLKAVKHQLGDLEKEINETKEEAARWQSQAVSAETQKSHLQQQLRVAQWQVEEKESAIREVRGQLAAQLQEIRNLNCGISSIQHKYHSLMQQYQQQLSQWQHFSLAARQQQSQLHNSRLSAEYELDNSQATIAILKQQNSQLQRIFGVELQRRNSIIRELMAEKRSLYSQLMGRLAEE